MPYKAVVYLNMTFSNGLTYRGSGTMIGNDTVLTAAHNLYSKEFGWAKKVTVYAGKDGQKINIGQAHSKKLYSLKEWRTSADFNYDIGLIKLDSNLGKKTGVLDLSSNVKINEKVSTSGFPADKNKIDQYNTTGVLIKITNNQLLHNMDTYPGQSGSSIRNAQNKIIGVHR